jgi:hypothetical protein
MHGALPRSSLLPRLRLALDHVERTLDGSRSRIGRAESKPIVDAHPRASNSSCLEAAWRGRLQSRGCRLGRVNLCGGLMMHAPCAPSLPETHLAPVVCKSFRLSISGSSRLRG